MKQDFSEVVYENTHWLLSYVKKSVKNGDVAEDLVQEIFIKAYRSYDSYEESGQLRSWLSVIARNTIYNYNAAPGAGVHLSLDAVIEEEEDVSLYNMIPDTVPTPEEALLHRELTDSVMQALASMPPSQRTVLTYRYIEGLSVAQTAARMGIPKGSVKSGTHYALRQLRDVLGVERSAAKNKKAYKDKGDKMMKCEEAYRYLFQYALDRLPDDEKVHVAAHLEICPACRDKVTALRSLIPHLPVGRVGETTHYNIDFPDIDIGYSNVGNHYENAERLNAYLRENDGRIPEGEHWSCGGSSKIFPLLAMFDDEGFPLEYVIGEAEKPEFYSYDIRRMRKIGDPIHWQRSVVEDKTGFRKPKASYAAPNFYTGRVNNSFGRDANSGIYIALPKAATNIRLKRGNGVIDCGTYQFVYVQRYVIESETIWLEYTYNM